MRLSAIDAGAAASTGGPPQRKQPIREARGRGGGGRTKLWLEGNFDKITARAPATGRLIPD